MRVEEIQKVRVDCGKWRPQGRSASVEGFPPFQIDSLIAIGYSKFIGGLEDCFGRSFDSTHVGAVLLVDQ